MKMYLFTPLKIIFLSANSINVRHDIPDDHPLAGHQDVVLPVPLHPQVLPQDVPRLYLPYSTKHNVTATEL